MNLHRLQIVQKFSEAWARRNLDEVMSFFTDDCVYAASVGPEPGITFRGRENVRRGIEQMFQHDQGSTPQTGRMFCDGERVFAEWRYVFPEESGRKPAHGCDMFEFEGDKIRLKEAFRKELKNLPQGMAGGFESGEYRPRLFDAHEPWLLGDWTLKLILISHNVAEPPYTHGRDVVAAAREHVCKLLPDMEAVGRHYGLGFVILHEGEEANWLLLDWWHEGGIACQILSRSTIESPLVFERVQAPLMACVWEMWAIDHERLAWIQTMMNGNPDRLAYLARTMPSGLR